MSKFSIYLKKLIDRNKTPISSIAKSIGAERTSLHRALKDERILPYTVVQDLARHLQLSLEERQEFFRLYDMLIQGEDVWRNRAAVCDLMNHLSTIQFPSVSQPELSYASFPSSSNNLSEGLIEGEYSVQNMLYTLLSKEAGQNADACFQIFLPAGTDLSRTLMQLWNSGNKFRVDQLFYFPTIVDNDCSKNVRILQHIIPLCFIARESYHPYYFYEHPGVLSVNPLTYYIITPHYLVLLSTDQSRALIQTSEHLIQYFSNYFRELKAYCEPLVSCNTTLPEILETCTSMINSKGALYLMPQPCFGRYYTPEIIAKYFRSDEGFATDMYQTVVEYFSMLQNTKNDFYTIFSEEGLQYFSETGVITELPQEYVSSIDKRDRLHFLSQLRNDIASGRVIGRIVHPSSLRIPNYLTLYTDAAGNVWFDTTADFTHGAYYCDIHFSEKSVSNAFQDFLQSISGSQLVYSLEDTLQILDKYIRNLA